MLPGPTPRRRLFVAIGAVFAAVVATVVATEQTASAASVTFQPGTVVGEAPDYALSHFNDKWDFSNASDMLLDRGPSNGIIGAHYTGGVLAYSITGNSYATPLWGGYPGSLFLGRDGALRSNQIDINYYSRIHLRAYVSRKTFGVLLYYTCSPPKSACQGGPSFTLAPGWNDVDLPIRSAARPTRSSLAQNLRVALLARAPTSVQLDFLRVYHPVANSWLQWTSPEPGTSATLFWSDGADFPKSRARHGGPVVSPKPAVNDGSGWTTTDVSGYPAGSRFYAVSAHGVATPPTQAVTLTPLGAPVIDSPSAAGCGDYATRAIGHPWRFNSPSTVSRFGNASRVTWGSRLSATNAGPQRNDPHLFLRLGRTGIDGRTWHRLTIVESYDGRFDLHNAPGGGTMARVMWGRAGSHTLAQTNDVLTYSGTRTITLDLAWPASRLTEPDGTAAQRYAFAGPYRITQLRWDPNEDPGSRRWHVYTVRLAADCATRTTFNIVWHDAQFVTGNKADVLARDARGHLYRLATVTEQRGSNTMTLNSRRVPSGVYTILVVVRNAAGQSRGTAAGPLVVRR